MKQLKSIVVFTIIFIMLLLPINTILAADIDTTYNRFRHAFGNTELTRNYTYQVFFYNNGHVYMTFLENGKACTKEYIYIHLQKRKNLKVDLTQTLSYYITNMGFYDKKENNITQSIIEKYNPYPGEMIERNEQEAKYRLLRKLRLKGIIESTAIGKGLVIMYNFIKYRIC